jgi:hypothetical protein
MAGAISPGSEYIGSALLTRGDILTDGGGRSTRGFVAGVTHPIPGARTVRSGMIKMTRTAHYAGVVVRPVVQVTVRADRRSPVFFAVLVQEHEEIVFDAVEVAKATLVAVHRLQVHGAAHDE